MFRSSKPLYTDCYDKIEILKKEAISTKAVNKFADVSKTVGNFIGNIPVVKKGPVDEFLVSVGDTINEKEKTQLEKTLKFFIQYKDSGLVPVAEHIDVINNLSNKPVIMMYDKKNIQFYPAQDAV